MSGTSHGMSKHQFIGCRIGTSDKIKMLYTPAHVKADGKPVSARLVIPILVNERRKENPNSFRLIAWGGLADLFAKSLSKGKEMNFICNGSSYWGNVFYEDGTPAMQKNGQVQLQTRQTSFKITEFTFGADSNNTINEEINGGMLSGEGRRPAQWNIVGSPDNLAWKQMLALRSQTFYQGGDKFGYATVVAPRSAGCTVLLGDQSKILRTNAQVAPVAVAPPASPTVAPAVVNAPIGQTTPLVNQVQNTLNPPVQAPVQNALPVYNAPA